jgi:hypothetical protein
MWRSGQKIRRKPILRLPDVAKALLLTGKTKGRSYPAFFFIHRQGDGTPKNLTLSIVA